MAGQVGFDEGALFNTLSKPKHTVEKFTYNDDGTVLKKTTTVKSYWDLIMIAGGPALIMLIVGLIKTIGTRIPSWFSDKEKDFIKEHPLAFLAMGPIGFKLAFKKADTVAKIAKLDDTSQAALWLGQIAENYGISPRGSTAIPILNPPMVSQTEDVGIPLTTPLGFRSEEIDPETGRVTVKLGFGRDARIGQHIDDLSQTMPDVLPSGQSVRRPNLFRDLR
jgi:hypothetical protein